MRRRLRDFPWAARRPSQAAPGRSRARGSEKARRRRARQVCQETAPVQLALRRRFAPTPIVGAPPSGRKPRLPAVVSGAIYPPGRVPPAARAHARRCGGRQPYPLPMRADMRQGAAQMAQAMGLADDIGMQRDAHHQRFARALRQHLVEMVDDHLGEGRALDPTRDDHRNVVDLLGIRHRQQRAMPGAHEQRLIVHAPVEQIFVARLRQEVGGGAALRNPRPEPALGRGALLPRNDRGRLADQRGFFGFAQLALLLAVGAAVPDKFVAARAEGLGQTGRAGVNVRIDQHGGGRAQPVQQVDQPPAPTRLP